MGFIIELFTNLAGFITKYKKRGQSREKELVIHTYMTGALTPHSVA